MTIKPSTDKAKRKKKDGDLSSETKEALERYYAQPLPEELDPQEDADFGHALGLDWGD